MKHKISFVLLFAVFFLPWSIGKSVDIKAADLPSYCYEPYDSDIDYTECITDPDSETDPDIDSGEYDLEGYREIYKKDNIWYGIIDIEEMNIIVAETGVIPNTISVTNPTQNYALEIALTRDTKNLLSIDLQFTRSEYCAMKWTWLCNISGTVEKYQSGVITYSLDSDHEDFGTSRNLEEAFGDGDITNSVDPNFDYVINLNHTTNNQEAVHIELDVLQFTYILTDQEVDLVMNDIQEQYNKEVETILHDNTLTITSKQLALDQLNLEYAEFTITYDEEITSLCVNDDNCSLDQFEEDPLPEDTPVWVDNLLEKIGTILLYVIGALFSGGFIAYIVYMFGKKSIEATGSTALTIGKGTIKTGLFTGEKIGKGLLFILSPIGRGAKVILEILNTGIKKIFTLTK